MKRSREILVFLMLLLGSLFLYGDESKIPYVEIKENPKTEVNTVVADKNGRDKQLNLSVNKLLTQQLQLAPLVEYGENGERYYVFEIEKEKDKNKEYKYFVTDDKLSIPRKNIVNGKKIGENQSKVLEFTVETRDRTEDEDGENPTLEESKVKEKEKIDAVKIKIDSNLTGDYIYIVKTDKTGTEAFKVYSYKLYKSKSISSKAIDLPNVGKWAALVLLEANQDIPSPLFETGAVEGIDEYQFYDDQFVYVGKVETENVNDRTVKFMVRLMAMKDVASNPRYGQTIEVNGNWSNAGNAVYFGSQKVAGGEINTEYLLAIRGLGSTSNHTTPYNSTEGPNGEKPWTPTLQVQGSDVVVRNVSRVVNICWLWGGLFNQGYVYGTPDKTEWYRLATVKLPSNLAPGLYYLEAGSFYGLIRLRTTSSWLWKSDVDKSGMAYHQHPNVDTFYEKPVPYMGIMATRDAILNRDVVLDGRDATLVVNNKVKIAKWINSQTIEAGKSLGGYHDIFYYMFPAKNQAYFQLENGENGKRNTMAIPQGLSRGEYKLDIRAGIVNNTNDGIMVLKGKNLRIADTNDGIDEFNVWYIDKTVNSELDVNLSQVHIGTWTGWAPKSINNTAIGTNVGKSYGGTKSGINADGAILKRVSGEVFDSLEWSQLPAPGKFVMGADKVVATDNGAACEVIKDQQSKTQIVKVKNTQGEVVAYVGIEGSGTNLGYIFVEKVRRDYKPHRIVLEALDRKGYSFGTITINLTLDEVKPLGYIGAEISQELLTAMKTDNKTYYTLNGTDGTRSVATIGGVGNSNIQVPQFTNVELDLAGGLSLTGISYNELKREYTHGTGMKTLCADLTNIRYWETTKGTVIDANYQSMEPAPNVPITKVYTDFNQLYKDITVDMIGVSETNAGHPSETDDFRFIIQSKKKSGVYGNSYTDDVLKETITDNGEFFEVRVIPMIVPKTPEGNFTINANTPTKYDYMHNGVPYEYIFTNDTSAYNKDLGIAKRDDVVSTRPSTAIGTNPNGNIPPRYSSFDTAKEISTEMQVNTSTITGTKYQDAKARYEFELTKNGTNNVPAMSFKIKTPFKIDETIVVTTRTRVAGLNTAVETGKSTIKIVAGSDIMIGTGDLDLTKVRKDDIVYWNKNLTSDKIQTIVNGTLKEYPGVVITQTSGQLFITETLMLDKITKLSVQYGTENIDSTAIGTKMSCKLSSLEIGLDSGKFYLNKLKEKVDSGNIVINGYDANGDKIVEATLTITDNSDALLVNKDTIMVSDFYRYYLSSDQKMNYLGINGKFYSTSTKLIANSDLTSTTVSEYLRKENNVNNTVIGTDKSMDLIGVEGENKLKEYTDTTPLAPMVYGYGTTDIDVVIPSNKSLTSGVLAGNTFLTPIYFDVSTLGSGTVNTTNVENRKTITTYWRTTSNQLRKTEIEIVYTELPKPTGGSAVIDLRSASDSSPYLAGYKLPWAVDMPRKATGDLTGSLIYSTPSNSSLKEVTGNFFVTRVTSNGQYRNYVNRLVVEKYPAIVADERNYNTVATEKDDVTGNETLVKTTALSEVEFGIENGMFYVKKLKDKIVNAKYKITAYNSYGEVGEITLEILDSIKEYEVRGKRFYIEDTFENLIANSTPTLKWIGANGKLYSTATGGEYSRVYTSDFINFHDDNNGMIGLPTGKTYEVIKVEMIDTSNMNSAIELTKMQDGLYGKDGIGYIYLPHEKVITSISNMNFDAVKIRAINDTRNLSFNTVKRIYKFYLKASDRDVYITTVKDYAGSDNLRSSTSIFMENAFDTVKIGDSRTWQLDEVLKGYNTQTYPDTTGKTNVQFQNAATPHVDTYGIISKITYSVEGVSRIKKIWINTYNAITGATQAEMITATGNSITVPTDFFDFKFENGQLTVTKKRSIFSGHKYELTLYGVKDEIIGTIDIWHRDESVVKKVGYIHIDDKLVDYGLKKGYTQFNSQGLLKMMDSSSYSAENMIILESPNTDNTIPAIKEIIDIKKGTTKLDKIIGINTNYDNYGNTVFISKDTTTIVTVEDLMKKLAFDLSNSKIEATDTGNVRTNTYIIRYTGIDEKIYEITFQVYTRYPVDKGDGSVDLSSVLVNATNTFISDTSQENKNLKMTGTNLRFILQKFYVSLVNKHILDSISVNGVKQNGLAYDTPNYKIDLGTQPTWSNAGIAITKKANKIYYDTLELVGYYKDIPLDTFVLQLKNVPTINGKGKLDFTKVADNTLLQWLPDEAINQQTPSITGNTPIVWNTIDDRLFVTEYNGKSVIDTKNLKIYTGYEDVAGNAIGYMGLRANETRADGTFAKDVNNQIEVGFTNDGKFTIKKIQNTSGENIKVQVVATDTSGLPLGTLDLLIKMTDRISGSADIDFTKVRMNDSISWGSTATTNNISKTLYYSTDWTKGTAVTFSGITMENISGEILNTTKLLSSIPTGATIKVKVDGIEYTGTRGLYDTPEIRIQISGKTIGMTKKVEKLSISNVIIEVLDASGKVLLQNSFNLIDNSTIEKVAEETMTVYKNYKYFLPSNALEIKYISKDGRLYTALTQIGNSNSYTGNSQINYNSQILATKGLSAIYLNPNQTGLGTTGTLYTYDTKNIVKYAGHNIFVGVQSTVDTNGNFTLPIIYDLTSNTKNTIIGKKEKYDLTNSLFEWLANDNTIKSINFKVDMIDYRTEGEGKVDFTGKTIGEKILWSVNPPTVNGEDLVFEQANTINVLQNATGEFFPTKIDGTTSINNRIGLSNIPNELVVERYNYDENTNTYPPTASKTVTIRSISATSLRSSSTDFSDIYIGISNGDFYVEKKENRIQKAKYVITAKNNNGELGTFSLIVESTPQLHSFGTVTYNIFEPLKEVIVKDTPNVKWIGGINGQTLYTYVGATNTFTESSEKFNEYMDRTDALIFPAGQKLKFIGIEKDRVGTTAGTELTKIAGNVYGINGTPEIEISSTINVATEISSITGLKLDNIKINTKTAGKYSIKFFNEADGDIYYYDVALSGKTVANIDGEGKISLAGIEKNRELEFDISGKIIGDTVNGLSIENGKVVYLGIDNTMIPQQVIFTKNIEASKTIGVTLDGTTRELKIDDSMNTIKIKNGKLYVTKKDVTFEDIVYKLALSGYKANNGFTSLGTFILRVTKETPIERTEILSIDNRLFEENSDYNLVNLDGLAKIGTTDKVVAGDSITFKSQNDTMVEIKEVLSVFDNTTKLTPKNEVNGMDNYGDKVYLPKTITATKVSDLLKNIYFNTTPLKLSDAETTKTAKYSIQYIGTDNKVYNLIVDVVVNRGVIIDGNAVLDFGQLLYNSSNNLHYGDTEVTIKALKAGRNVRIELKNQDIELSTKTTPISKMNVKNLGVKLITPAPKPADEKTSGTVVGTDGKATFKVSGYAEVLKTTQVGKYFGEATVDVYITD